MAEPYLNDVTRLAGDWSSADDRVGDLECDHFFSGAAVYRDGGIVATLTPVGLAFKVSAEVHDVLIGSGRAVPLRYFPKAPIKKNWVVFVESGAVPLKDAIDLVLGEFSP